MASNSYYTQNDEEKVFLDYFGSHIGTVVDIGANDGETFSNSARLIEMGWNGYLIEPHKEAFEKCLRKYWGHGGVHISNIAIGTDTKEIPFHAGSDSMLSSLHADHMKLWPTTIFEQRTVQMFTWADYVRINKIGQIDFISIDAEGSDWSILQQIDLTDVKMLCIEVGAAKFEIMGYCLAAGMKKIHQTFENIIFAR